MDWMVVVYIFASFGAVAVAAIAYGLWLTRGIPAEMNRGKYGHH